MRFIAMSMVSWSGILVKRVIIRKVEEDHKGNGQDYN